MAVRLAGWGKQSIRSSGLTDNVGSRQPLILRRWSARETYFPSLLIFILFFFFCSCAFIEIWKDSICIYELGCDVCHTSRKGERQVWDKGHFSHSIFFSPFTLTWHSFRPPSSYFPLPPTFSSPSLPPTFPSSFFLPFSSSYFSLLLLPPLPPLPQQDKTSVVTRKQTDSSYISHPLPAWPNPLGPQKRQSDLYPPYSYGRESPAPNYESGDQR